MVESIMSAEKIDPPLTSNLNPFVMLGASPSACYGIRLSAQASGFFDERVLCNLRPVSGTDFGAEVSCDTGS